MSDADLARKFHGLVDPVLGAAHAERLIEQCVAIAGASDVRALAAMAGGTRAKEAVRSR